MIDTASQANGIEAVFGPGGQIDSVLQAGDWAFVAANWEYLLAGTVVTILLTITSLSLGFLAGFPAGAIEVYGSGRLSDAVSTFGVLLRGTPIVVLVVLFHFGLPLPRLGSIPWLEINLTAFLSATLALGLRSGAYQSQVFRGAIQSIDDGQLEAARSVGMSTRQSIRHVVFPQALRRSLPGFQNEFTIVLKDTSIAFAIGLAELLTRAENLYLQPGKGTAVMEVILTITAIYFVLTFATNRSLDALHDRYSIPGGSE
ncbi:amino acid ABC transporter permease [Halapricum hydrolyticum]|uniref:Amino acid ABC transporter permease n=1 Tax=Halapricum hydrolyticum TaxID=2979991 RepID=A0AAE3IDD0_9EURY|nr:amino acid ABC transporter permease [Halapricum hydrolyticum]MCU4718179.1 amino acid ABC transporter permease [Halapricum hydrolyticum]MCU4726380.1 amino acid ABC transporter permease [Halapricum hydrolyticum]